MEYIEAPKRKTEVVGRLEGKKTREESNYRPQRDPDSKETCFDCEHYISEGEPESECEVIAGMVEAEDVCDYWKARAEKVQPQITIQIRS